MFDFSPVRSREMTLTEFTAKLTPDDLRRFTNGMVDRILKLIDDCTDADVVFEPVDPEAHDSYAVDEAETDLAWNLGHLIVHVTASLEEGAALAAELARGVEFHGRSRSEVPWRSVTAISQCRQRLEESRRMCLASLEMWPDQPDLENYYQRREGAPEITAVVSFVFGLAHAESHLKQIEAVVDQAKESAAANRRL
jgi:hypothetical protein